MTQHWFTIQHNNVLGRQRATRGEIPLLVLPENTGHGGALPGCPLLPVWNRVLFCYSTCSHFVGKRSFHQRESKLCDRRRTAVYTVLYAYACHHSLYLPDLSSSKETR
jgi:hypothetical protein